MLLHASTYPTGHPIDIDLARTFLEIVRHGSQDFRRQHDAALPENAKAALSFNLGPLGLQFILENGGSGYFRTRVVQSYLESGVLEQVPKAPEFSYRPIWFTPMTAIRKPCNEPSTC